VIGKQLGGSVYVRKLTRSVKLGHTFYLNLKY